MTFGNAKIALVVIAGSLQGVDGGVEVGFAYDHVDVDDGFGGKAGNRGAADMFDYDHRCIAQRFGQVRAHAIECLRPRRVVANHVESHVTSIAARPTSGGVGALGGESG